MKRILIILLLAVAAFPAFAQMGSPIIIPIWPDGAPNDNGIVTEEGHPSPRSVDNVSKPELWSFDPRRIECSVWRWKSGRNPRNNFGKVEICP